MWSAYLSEIESTQDLDQRFICQVLKSSRNKKDLNEVAAAPFFFLLAAEKKTPKISGQLLRH